MPDLIFRDATPKDAALLAGLGRQSFVETFGHLYRPEDLEAFLLSHSEENWAADLADPDLSVRLVEADGLAIAYAKIGPVSLPVQPQAPAAELRQFYMLAPWQGRGVAAELMAWVLDRARALDAEELYLSVYVDNHRARRFYDRYGFTFVAPYAFMVGEQADEDLIMRLNLKAAG